MIGCGSPIALQFSLRVEVNVDRILEGGLDVNRERDTTTNMVFFSAFPKRFFAEQVYTYIHKYIHACMHGCMHAYVHTYIHTYIHLYNDKAG